MNFRFVFNQLSLLLLVLGGFLLALAGWSFARPWWTEVTAADREASLALLIAAAVCGLFGGAVALVTRGPTATLGRREALLLVALSWVVGAAVAGLPYRLWAQLHFDAGGHPFANFVNCYFEAMSGLTTTGATILGQIEDLPHALLLWRATTHWLGGIGIVVLFVAVLPSLGAGGKKLFRVEAPGPAQGGVRPHIRDTARVLWFIYVGLTFVEVLALRVAGMTWFDAVCHTFATVATGGFSTMNASVGHYDSVAMNVIIIVFMILAGANFGLYYQLIRGRWQVVWRDVELRAYLLILAVASVLVVCSIWSSADAIVLTQGRAATVPSDFAHSLEEGLFTTVSIQTTTGFCTSDFDRWPYLAKAVLVVLMFVGGCAGSTGGGVKVIRIWLAFKVMIAELERSFRPNVIRPVRVGGATVDADAKLSIIAFVLGGLVVVTAGTATLMLFEAAAGHECRITTAATASLATMCTIGPGLGRVGAVENYGWFTDASKIVMSLLMALGRLEFFALLVLFSPRFWRGD